MAVVLQDVVLQFDDDFVERLDKLAAEQGMSRSALVSRIVTTAIAVAESETSDRELQEAYRRIPQDTDLVASASRVAAVTTPEWYAELGVAGEMLRDVLRSPGGGGHTCIGR